MFSYDGAWEAADLLGEAEFYLRSLVMQDADHREAWIDLTLACSTTKDRIITFLQALDVEPL
jgi:hypothetical protein